MSKTHSISELVQQIQEGQSAAAHQLWSRFIDRLIGAARRHLRNLPRRVVDEEDVAVSAFDAFLRGVKEGRFKKLETKDDLWTVLAMLTERKAIGVLRKELADKRGGGQVRGESVFEQMLCESSVDAGIAQVSDPAPEVVEVFTIEVRELLDGLGDEKLARDRLAEIGGLHESRDCRAALHCVTSCRAEVAIDSEQVELIADPQKTARSVRLGNPTGYQHRAVSGLILPIKQKRDRTGKAVGSAAKASTSQQSLGHTKAVVVVPVPGVVPVAVPRLAVPGVVVPAAAPVHPVRAL